MNRKSVDCLWIKLSPSEHMISPLLEYIVLDSTVLGYSTIVPKLVLSDLYKIKSRDPFYLNMFKQGVVYGQLPGSSYKKVTTVMVIANKPFHTSSIRPQLIHEEDADFVKE